MTAIVDAPHGYGRIVRSGERIARIVEERDATREERGIREINSGIYVFDLPGLFEAVRGIASENAQREYYLPDLVAIFRQLGRVVETMTVANPDEIRGINSRGELAEVSHIVRQQKNNELMAAGVTIEDPATTYIDRTVAIAADTIVHPGVSLEGQTTIGAGCEIHSGARIVNSRIGDRVTVLNHCVITDSAIGNDAASARSRTCAMTRRSARPREGRQFRRAEKHRARRRLEGDAPDLSRRRDDRREGERRRRARSPATTTA